MRSVGGSDPSLLDGVPIVREAFPRTVRLVSTARLRDPVLLGLVDDADEMNDLAEIEGATSARLITEERGSEGLPAGELVHGVPHARFINASFVYASRASRTASMAPIEGLGMRRSRSRRVSRRSVII